MRLTVRCGSETNQAEAGGHLMPPLGGHVTLKADESREWSGSWQLAHWNERDAEAVQIWDCMVEERLIIVWYYRYQQDASSFLKSRP